MSKLQVKIDGERQDLVKIEEDDYKNFEWGKDKTYVKEPLRSSGEVKGNINAKFELQEVKKILTDIRDYLVEKKKICDFIWDLEREMFIDTLLSDLTEYAEKLGVEL